MTIAVFEVCLSAFLSALPLANQTGGLLSCERGMEHILLLEIRNL